MIVLRAQIAKIRRPANVDNLVSHTVNWKEELREPEPPGDDSGGS
jgi:hypothetical protein